MRLLAEANENPEIFKMKATCSGKGWIQEGKNPCYRLWEIDATDVLKRVSSNIDGYLDVYYGFVCPKCGCFTELEASEIPDYVKNGAKKYDGSKTNVDID